MLQVEINIDHRFFHLDEDMRLDGLHIHNAPSGYYVVRNANQILYIAKLALIVNRAA